MSFAENKFLIIIAAVAVILAGGLVYYGMSISSAIEDEQMAAPRKLASDIDRFARGTPANLETIEAKRQRVDKMKEQRQKVVEMDVAFNRRERAYVIPELTLKAENGAVKPALPFVKQVWDRNGLYYEFVEAYYRHLENQIGSMNRVVLPTEAEIQTEAVKIQKRLDRMELRRTKSGQAAGAPGRSVLGAPRASATDGKLSEEALTTATNQLRLAKAQKGRLYVDINSFEQMFVRGVMIPSLEPEQIWRAHLAMWVSSDIVDAVNQTIDDVFTRENVPEDQRNVLASPIKSLASVTLSEVPLSARRTEMTREDQYGGPGGPGGRRPTPTIGGQDLPTASTLSRRVSSPLYNVVRYSFTVVMPTRYIPTLQSKLIHLNYHTILNQEIVPLAGQQADLRYFGTEPVRQVTFTGEVVLLSDWVRGTWNKETETWTYLPLMPIPVMQNRLADAQRRDTDEQLIEGRLPRPWDPTYTPPEEPARRAGRNTGRRIGR